MIDKNEVLKKYNQNEAQIVWTKIVADLDTPVSAFLKLAETKANSFLLESVEGGAITGRYSFIGFNPDLIWRCFGEKAEINRQAQTDTHAFISEEKPTLESLDQLVEESKIDLPDGFPPMAAGLIGYMAYDTIRLVENIPAENPDSLKTPDGIFIRPTVMAVFDNIEHTVTIVAPIRPHSDISAEDAYMNAVGLLSDTEKDFKKSLAENESSWSVNGSLLEAQSNTSREEFHQMVEKAKDYILAGDIFQVVLSQRFEMPFELPAFALYRALRRTNPSPFLFFLNFEDFSIVGSSPEILVRLRDGKVTIRPIAGTRPRGATPAEDKALAEDLLSDQKECAEHLMLLDLGRNDVGRVSKIGTVNVTDKFFIENYSHVMHIVSNVEGDVRNGVGVLEALMAGFPAGTVSGAPKVRAMEIIDELEKAKRGIYAGCIGYFGADGDMDTCIALRTAIVKDNKMIVQAGAGIVADSNPESEYMECHHKSRALIRAAQEAVKLATKDNNSLNE